MASILPAAAEVAETNALAAARVAFVHGDYSNSLERLDKLIAAAGDQALEARWLALELARETGRRAARDAHEDFFFQLYGNGSAAGDAVALTAVAYAAERDDPHGAWRAYRQAHKADRDYVKAYVYAGFHCLERNALRLAKKEFTEAVKRGPAEARGYVGLAAVALAGSDYVEADALADKALAVNPELAMAHELKYELLALDDRHEEARAWLRRALAVNSNSASALALLAADREKAGDTEGRDRAIAAVAAVNPDSVDAFVALAESAERHRRFAAATTWARRAIERDDDDWRGYYLAAMNLLRLGEEPEGYKLLDRAFQLNGFNIWAYNMLTVLDKDFKRKQYVYRQSKHFFVKMEKREDPVLWPYLEPALEDAYARFSAAYGFSPTGPEACDGKVLVVILPTHAEFSARTAGLPALGILAACFGQVITMPSPRIGHLNPAARFNWKNVLDHEFVHVVTLQKTDYNIPRWLTEGISVIEERDAQTHADELLRHAVAENKLAPIAHLNTGFTRPRFRGAVDLAYVQAAFVCRRLATAYGPKTITKILDELAAGHDVAEAIATATGADIASLDRDVTADIQAFAQELEPLPEIGDDLEPEAAIAALEAARRARPRHVHGANNPYERLVHLYLDGGQTNDAIAVLQAKLALSTDDYDGWVRLAELLAETDAPAAAAAAYQEAMYIDPYVAEIHRRAAGLYEGLGNIVAAEREHRVAEALEPRPAGND